MLKPTQIPTAPRSALGRHRPNADRDSLDACINSAKRFDDTVRQAGANIILSNHTDWDRSKFNPPALATRAPSSSSDTVRLKPDTTTNPYVVGNEAARSYLKVAEECATVRLPAELTR